MSTHFEQLNSGWNAEPNAPYEEAEWIGNNLVLRFRMNAFQFDEFSEGDVGELTFTDCARYRIGRISDEGWFRGQCRFSKIAPKWGEFYSVSGDLRLGEIPDDWDSRTEVVSDLTHFLFYLRDNEFECDAREWSLQITKHNKAEQGNHV